MPSLPVPSRFSVAVISLVFCSFWGFSYLCHDGTRPLLLCAVALSHAISRTRGKHSADVRLPSRSSSKLRRADDENMSQGQRCVYHSARSRTRDDEGRVVLWSCVRVLHGACSIDHGSRPYSYDTTTIQTKSQRPQTLVLRSRGEIFNRFNCAACLRYRIYYIRTLCTNITLRATCV